MVREPFGHIQRVSASETDAIRATKFKIDIVTLFPAIIMGRMMAWRETRPSFLTLFLTLFLVGPVLVVARCSLLGLLPGYPRRRCHNFLVSRATQSSDFILSSNPEIETYQLPMKYKVLSDILLKTTLRYPVVLFIFITEMMLPTASFV